MGELRIRTDICFDKDLSLVKSAETEHAFLNIFFFNQGFSTLTGCVIAILEKKHLKLK